ncbi:hypothetical protein HPP92_023246 [Vanilla planifolia]|uniref:Uncharacterized protein n=1 Tax=Vanilla planifolia TaxID=51239 RepID=A0A835UG64_VANPL|nr:hypothetical protein HPP92_023246 [Vanilla planifolia]
MYYMQASTLISAEGTAKYRSTKTVDPATTQLPLTNVGNYPLFTSAAGQTDCRPAQRGEARQSPPKVAMSGTPVNIVLVLTFGRRMQRLPDRWRSEIKEAMPPM